MTYRINTFNGAIHREDGLVILPPYDHPAYIEYAEWVTEGNEPETFFEGPEVAVPASVTARQARLALLGAGKLSLVDAALAAIPGVQGEAARIEWEYASEIRRDSPLIAALAPALGLTAEQVDDMFRTAVTL